MSLSKQPNRPPNDIETTKLNEWIAQEEAILASIRKLEREREQERVRLLNRSSLLRSTLRSTKVVQDVASKMFSNNSLLLKKLEEEIAYQEARISAISECFPSTHDFIKELKDIASFGSSLQSALKRQLECIGSRIASVDEKLESTVDLEAYIVHTVSSASAMASEAEGTIQKKRQGLLHPIRRLPAELLEGIFQACVHDESRGWLNDPSRTPGLPKAAIRVASVCRFWRSVALQCPHLWRCLRAPIQVRKTSATPWGAPVLTTATYGVEHFRSSLRLRGDLAIELTIPPQVSIPGDIDLTQVQLERLNLLNVANQWSPIFPSPLHLWVGQPAGNSALTRTIPFSLLLRTKIITAFSVGLTFEAPSNSVTHLVISGRQPTIPFIPILTSLPNLEELDVNDAQIYQTPVSGTHQALRHSKLRRIRLHSSCFSALEQSLSGGLQLPQLRSLTISNLTTPFIFPFISAQFGATVTSLDFHGTETKDPQVIRNVINNFHRINTLTVSGTAVSATLHALYRVPANPHARKLKENALGNREIQTTREMPKGLEKIVIQNYGEDGSTIQKVLRMMRSNPAADTEPIEVIFDGCPNIRKDIREEFKTAGPIIVTMPETGSHYDPSDLGQLSDHLLGLFNIADGGLV